jgi:flavin reductase (DIM6/NTAB) family NADH-FMN oxidoreductase RutF
MKKTIDPSILYFGTPVILVSTSNGDGTDNLAPISSVFWLGWRAMIGISALSKTTENLLRTRECVLNLPSANEVGAVNRLALTTGSNPVPEGKQQKGYRYEPDKFRAAGLTPRPADLVNTSMAMECPVQLEARLMAVHPIAEDQAAQRGRILSLELKIVRVHVQEEILMDGYVNRIDPDKWRPLIMSFQEFYGLGQKLHSSTLGGVPERLYRTRDIEEAMEDTRVHEEVTGGRMNAEVTGARMNAAVTGVRMNAEVTGVRLNAGATGTV